ncbi:hypothetical protein SSX86_002002 [Deinandra increscens subsp. villosa]|uniref:DOG1 domain-containing protein n=1 Tax=Deinandra increscens subsp. villosa TaxID=3103831 RepID=A0AAP0DRE6_9ASTR
MDNSSTRSQPDFETFFRDWVTRLELYLQELLHLLNFLDKPHESKQQQLILIRQVTTHYQEYFLAKAQVSRHDVFLVLSPPWLSSYERTFLWLAGFKPTLVIYVVKNCGIEFGYDQAERLEKLVVETKDEEGRIAEGLAMLERQVVEPPMLGLARMGGREVNGMISEVDTAVDKLAEHMEVLVGCADYLREKTVANVVGILTTAQTVRFLAAFVQLQLRIRRWGQQWEHGTANLP